MTNVHPTPRVVVGVDGSPQSKQALRWAAGFAAATGARIDAIAAWQYPVSYGWSAVAYDYSPEKDAEKALTETVDEVFGPDRPADLHLTVSSGYAATVLLDAAKTATLVVVGSRGHGGFAGLLLGSVSAALAEHAACPVLVVHGDEPPPRTTA
jgi:nucleotide-binding universal stress UspA family protein